MVHSFDSFTTFHYSLSPLDLGYNIKGESERVEWGDPEVKVKEWNGEGENEGEPDEEDQQTTERCTFVLVFTSPGVSVLPHSFLHPLLFVTLCSLLHSL